jgi:hypothetical protein
MSARPTRPGRCPGCRTRSARTPRPESRRRRPRPRTARARPAVSRATPNASRQFAYHEHGTPSQCCTSGMST